MRRIAAYPHEFPLLDTPWSFKYEPDSSDNDLLPQIVNTCVEEPLARAAGVVWQDCANALNQRAALLFRSYSLQQFFRRGGRRKGGFECTNNSFVWHPEYIVIPNEVGSNSASRGRETSLH